jgi:acetate kinase
VRKLVCEAMEYLGIQIDEGKNQVRSGEIREINTDDATVKVLIVPTNEELEIVKQCYELLTEDVAVS